MTSLSAGRLHVIGGGLAGSALATLMAEDGYDVTLYDATEPFASRWTRGILTAPENHKVAEPEIFYDPEGLVADFFAQWPEIPKKLVRPAHSVIGLKRDRRKPATIDLDGGISPALIRRRATPFAKFLTALNLWRQRLAAEDQRVDAASSPPEDDGGSQRGTYHRDALGVLAEVLFSMPWHRCSASQLARVLVPSFSALHRRSSTPVFSAIDPIILYDIAMPALRDHFLRAGGKIVDDVPLGDIDSTPEHATDLLFGDRQVTLKPRDAVVLALHPRPLCDAVPDIAMPSAPARRQTLVFEAKKPFMEPFCLFSADEFVRAVYCNRRHIQISLNSALHFPSDTTINAFAETIWHRCVWLCDQYLNLDLMPRVEAVQKSGCPAYSFVDAEAPFPELTPGVAAARHNLQPPWRNLFLCGDSFPVDYAPDPAALFASVKQVRKDLHAFFANGA